MSENIGSLYGEVTVKSNAEEVFNKDIKVLDAYGRAWSSTSNERVIPSVKKTEAAIDMLHGGMVSFGRSAMSVALGMIGAGGILQAMNTLSTLAQRGYQESRQLSNTSVQLAAALGYHSDALKRQREEMDATLAVEKQDTAAAQLRLANYIKDENQIRRLIPAVIDLARAKGIDLAAAADQVARAIADDSGELGRYKIILEGARGSTERVDSAIAGLTERFGGNAKAIADNMNWLEKFGKNLGDFFRDVWEGSEKELPLQTYIRQAKEEMAFIERLGATENNPQYAKYKKFLEDTEKIQERAAEAAVKRQKEIDQRADEALKREEARKKRREQMVKEEEENARLGEEISQSLTEKLAAENERRQALQLKNESDLRKKTSEAQTAVEAAHIKYRIDLYESMAEDENSTDEERMEYAKAASDERINLIKLEGDFRKKVIDDELGAMENETPQLAQQIEKVRQQLKKNIDVKVNLEAQAIQLSSENLEKEKANRTQIIEAWSDDIADGLTAGVNLVTAKTSDAFTSSANEIFSTIQQIGRDTQSEYLEQAGIIGGTVATVMQILIQSMQDSYEAEARAKRLRDDEVLTFKKSNAAIIEIRNTVTDWLASLGLGDYSNLSKNQLKSAALAVGSEQNRAAAQITGLDMSGVNAGSLAQMLKETSTDTIYKAMGIGKPDEVAAAQKEVFTKYPELKYLFEQLAQGKGTGNMYADLSSLRGVYLTGELAAKGAEISSAISNYDLNAGIDHTKSQTREDFEADLSAEEAMGKITALERAKLLYEASAGIEDYAARLTKGKFSDYYSQTERAELAAAYARAQESPTTNGAQARTFGAAEGGIFSSPTVISENGQLEAAVPLDNPIRAMQVLDQISAILPGASGGSHFSVSISIDPNIPVSVDFGRAIGAGIAEKMTQNLNARGHRL